MSEPRAALGEAFFLFRDGKIEVELSRGEFDAVLARTAPLPAFAGQKARVAYATIGAGLIVKSITCFLLEIDEQGFADPDFGVPFEELARKAGDGPNLGMGNIRLSCRSQCAIPWHVRSLWQPELHGSQNECMQVQRAVWKNRLGLELRALSASGDASEARPPERDSSPSADPKPAVTPPRGGGAAAVALPEARPTAAAPAAEAYTAALIRQYNQRLQKLAERHRAELEAQRNRLEKVIREHRRENQTLRLRLLREQERNRRLQALVRGQDGDD